MTNNTMLSVAYYEILKSFCSHDQYREWMTKPFKIGDKVHSTDAYFLLSIDSDKIKTEDEISELEAKKLNGVLITETNKNLTINVDEVKVIFKKAPQEDCYDFKGKNVECDECDGSGEVEWEYKNHTHEHDCPICDGQGKTSLAKKIKNGETRAEAHLCIDIGDSRFFVNKIQRLLNVAHKLGEEEITLIYQAEDVKGSLFKIKDLEILVMPCTSDDLKYVVASYK